MSRWDTFWRMFNPPLPDVMQAEMLRGVNLEWRYRRLFTHALGGVA